MMKSHPIDNIISQKRQGGFVMKGSIHYHKKAKRYYVEWYEKGVPGEKGKSYKIYKYKGEYINMHQIVIY
jgi:hypothetical protein